MIWLSWTITENTNLAAFFNISFSVWLLFWNKEIVQWLSLEKDWCAESECSES